MYDGIRLLLLSAFVVHMCPKSVSSTSFGGLNLDSHAKRDRHGQSGEMPVPSVHVFTNQCSQKHVRFLRGKKIDALGNDRDKYSEILVSSVWFGGLVKLQHATSKRFICFNDKGKLKVRSSGGAKCIFEEIMDNSTATYMYRSEHYKNQSFYLGFNKGGKKMTGPMNRRRKCYTFLKSGGPFGISERATGNGGVEFNREHMQVPPHPHRHDRNRKYRRRLTAVT